MCRWHICKVNCQLTLFLVFSSHFIIILHSLPPCILSIYTWVKKLAHWKLWAFKTKSKSSLEAYFLLLGHIYDFYPFKNTYNIAHEVNYDLGKSKMTLNSFCSRVTFMNQHFNYREELFWMFTHYKMYLDLASRIEIIFRNGYG